MTLDQQEEVFSNYLIDSWSFSKVSQFARNEKAFERKYIYREKDKMSASSVAGSAYHYALQTFFEEYKEKGKVELDVVDLQSLSYGYIDSVTESEWKLQKTTPTIEDCQAKANKIVTALCKFFFEEMNTYIDEIDEILDVEVYMDEFVTVNGVDIPLPCHGVADLVFRNKKGKVVVLDHKSIDKIHTEKEDVIIKYGEQGMTYVKLVGEYRGSKVDEVWIAETKASKYKDTNLKQVVIHKIIIDENTSRLLEAQLYEPLKRMLEATSNPDYIYLLNKHDNFVDSREMNEFCMRTYIAEVDDFDIPENKKALVDKRLKKVRDASMASIDPKVIRTFQKEAASFITYNYNNKDMSNSEKIQHQLRSFGIPAQIEHKFDGYSSDTYLLKLPAGTKISRLYNHRLDVASALGVENVRMEQNLFVYQGASYFVVETSKKREKDLIFDESYQVDAKVPVGVTNFQETIFWDLRNHSTPHALVCGGTGSGKSVWLKSTIAYAPLCGVEEIVVFDPKYDPAFKELSGAEVINDASDIEAKMSALVAEMNADVKAGKEKLRLIVFDEFADAVSQSRARYGKESMLEQNLQLLLQKGRSCGFRIVSATQRASTKIINGDAKVNFTVQICFKVQKEVDSKVVLDEGGAELLSGGGDGLFRSPEYPNMQRFQGFYIS